MRLDIYGVLSRRAGAEQEAWATLLRSPRGMQVLLLLPPMLPPRHWIEAARVRHPQVVALCTFNCINLLAIVAKGKTLALGLDRAWLAI